MIFALGRNMGVPGEVAGERRFEGVERSNGCCGRDKAVCIVIVELTMTVRVWENSER